MTRQSPRVPPSLLRLGPRRFVAFLRAVRGYGDIRAVRLANEELDRGVRAEDLFAPESLDGTGYYLSVKRCGPRRFEIGFGFVAGPTAGDGGTWTVTFDDDGVVSTVEGGELFIF